MTQGGVQILCCIIMEMLANILLGLVSGLVVTRANNKSAYGKVKANDMCVHAMLRLLDAKWYVKKLVIVVQFIQLVIHD